MPQSLIMSEDAKRIVELYRRHAQAWAAARASQQRHRPIEAAWRDRFLSFLPPHPAVLDLGCGSGEPIGCYLTERECELTGIDAAPE